MSDTSNDVHSVIAGAVAPLIERIDRVSAEQQAHARQLAQASARLDELAQQMTALQGQALWFEHRAEDAERYASGARSIVMQAEHQMQQDITLVNQRLLDITADLHRLHHIRESPEHELYQLHAEIGAIQRRLAQLEGAGTAQ